MRACRSIPDKYAYTYAGFTSFSFIGNESEGKMDTLTHNKASAHKQSSPFTISHCFHSWLRYDYTMFNCC